MSRYGELRLISCQSATNFAALVAKELETSLVKTQVVTFSNQNVQPEIMENISGSDAYIFMQHSDNLGNAILEMLAMIDAAKYASNANRVTIVVPYFPYARSDKKEGRRISEMAGLIKAFMREAGADRVLTMDPHSNTIEVAHKNLQVDALTATRILAEHIVGEEKDGFVFVAPDVGAAKYVKKHTKGMGIPWAILNKDRKDDTETAEMGDEIMGNVRDKKAFIFDDEALSGSTLIEGVDVLLRNGAIEVSAATTHGFLTKNGPDLIQDSPLQKLYITDTIPLPSQKERGKIEVVSVVQLFAQAIKVRHNDESFHAMRDRH